MIPITQKYLTTEEKRKKLIRFLDRKAFDPVLRKSEDDFNRRSEKEKLRILKNDTEQKKQIFHNKYHSPVEVKQNYLSYLNSDDVKRVSRKLEDLGLPQLSSIKDEFLELCQDLKV